MSTWGNATTVWGGPLTTWSGGQWEPRPPPPPRPPWPLETRPRGQLVFHLGWFTPPNESGPGGELAGGPTLDLADLDLLHTTELDLGFPEVREDVMPNPGRHGVTDKTKYFGTRVVTLAGKIAVDWEGRGRRQEVVNRFAPFLMPEVRPWLLIRFDDNVQRRLRLRADQWSRPQIANVQDWSASWKSPGFFEDAESFALVHPEVTTRGWAYDRGAAPKSRRYGPDAGAFTPFPEQWPELPHQARSYPSGGGTQRTITNYGQVPAEWRARIRGHIHGPRIVLTGSQPSEDKEIRFRPSYELALGESVVLDSAERTIWHEGMAGNTRYGQVDFSHTEWFQLAPGRNSIRLTGDFFEVGARMEFYWRNAYLL